MAVVFGVDVDDVDDPEPSPQHLTCKAVAVVVDYIILAVVWDKGIKGVFA